MSEKIIVQDAKSNATVISHATGQSEATPNTAKPITVTLANGNLKPTAQGQITNTSVIVSLPA